MADPEGMPTHYETKTTHQTTSAQPMAIGVRMDYIKSINGILKILEIVLSIITFICASVFPVFSIFFGGGWVQFVSMAAFILTLVLFIFHFINLIHKLPGPWVLIEFIYYCIFTGLFLIAAIVAAVKGWIHASVGATAFFAFAATAVFAVDTFFQFKNWRTGQTETVATTTTSSTTTTVETRQQTY